MKNFIKKITINDFRGFEGEKPIEFDDAELILFWGMNGFGKSSIFDAVEWGFTGKLSRYEKYTDPGRKQDFNTVKKILRNHHVSKPDTFVEIELNSGKTFGRKVKIEGNNSDYNPGEKIDNHELGLSALCLNNMDDTLVNQYFTATHVLSQDTINHFITSKKPDDRYKALSVNFGTSQFFSFDKNIAGIQSKITEKAKDIKNKIKSENKLAEELKKTLIFNEFDAETKINDVNKYIKIIFGDSDLTDKLFGLSEDKVKDPQGISQLIIKEKTNFENNYQKITAEKNDLKFISSRLESYSTAKKLLPAQVKEKSCLEKSLIIIDELESENVKINKEIENSSKKLDILDEDININSKKVKFISRYNEVVDFIESANKDIKTIEKKHQSHLKTQETNNKIINDLALRGEEQFTEVGKVKNLLKFISKNKSKLNDTATKLKILNEKIINNDKEIDVKNKGISALTPIVNKKKSSIDLFVSSVEKVIEQKYVKNSAFKKDLDEIEVSTKKITEKKEQKKEYNLNLKRSEDEIETMKKALKSNEKILSEAIGFFNSNKTFDVKCPICDTKFVENDLYKIIDKKLKDFGNNEISEMEKNRKDIKKKTSLTDEDINKITENIELNRTSIQNIVSLEVDTLRSSIISFELKNEKHSKNIEEIKEAMTYIKETFDKLTKKEYRDQDSAKTDLEVIKANLEEKLLQQDDVLKIAKGKVVESEALVKSGKKEIKLLTTQLKNSQNTEYKEFLKYVNTKLKSIEVDTLEDDMIDLQKKLESEHNILVRKIKDSKTSISSNKKIINDNLGKETKVNLKEKLEKLEVDIKSYEKLKDLLDGKCISLDLDVESISETNITKNEKSLDKDKEAQVKLLENANFAIEVIKDLKSYKKDSVTKKKIKKHKNKVDELTKTALKLETIKKSFVELKNKVPIVIEEFVKENLDISLFNNIYESLNPHRRFKMIDFNIKPHGSSLGIHFNALNDGKKARPEFLFSSAQLNTFGVSMFLSMALRQNWLNLDTILLDDPIQNLDDINVLSFIDFIRTMMDKDKEKKQIIISTHNERFYKLMKDKFTDYKLKSFRFESYGSVHNPHFE